jgi:hypothetical protein
MATNEDVIERLDRIVAILQLAHREQIESTRTALRADKANAAILDGAKKLTPAAKLKSAVMKKTGVGASTFSERVAALIELGVLEKEGGGKATQYRATGLI